MSIKKTSIYVSKTLFYEFLTAKMQKFFQTEFLRVARN